MLILALRTDKPESEIGLYEDGVQLVYTQWQAHRQLAETIHQKIQEVFASQGKALPDIDAVVVYKGPGSFTGLRIGLSVANALALSYEIPIIGATGEGWREEALARLAAGEAGNYVVPEYGADVHITAQKK
jgi:tRNA threonylcarbamoyladenosine biosynthesis protein TsaB